MTYSSPLLYCIFASMKGVVFFILRFLITYAILSGLYGVYIQKFDTSNPPATDSFTRFVSYQTMFAAEALGYTSELVRNAHLIHETEEEQTMDSIYLDNKYAVSVEEGCNGLSVAILFVSFIIGFGGQWKKLVWFIPMGLAFLHVANIGRILLLGILNVDFDGQGFHFFHKYLFTAIIYAAVFVLWIWWVNRFGQTQSAHKSSPAKA